MTDQEALLERVRGALEGLDGITEKKMFGGICFMHDGNMLGGVRRHKDGVGRFMFRIGKENEAEAFTRPGVEPMVHGGVRKGGVIWVVEEECDCEALRFWVALAHSYVGAMPPKVGAKLAGKKRRSA